MADRAPRGRASPRGRAHHRLALLAASAALLVASSAPAALGVSRPAGVSIAPVTLGSEPCTVSFVVEWESPADDVEAVRVTYDDGAAAATVMHLQVLHACDGGEYHDARADAIAACGSRYCYVHADGEDPAGLASDSSGVLSYCTQMPSSELGAMSDGTSYDVYVQLDAAGDLSEPQPGRFTMHSPVTRPSEYTRL